MSTNVNKIENQNPIPAGIISGMEGFYDESTKTKWLAIDGNIKPLDQHSASIQNQIVTIFLNDTYSRNYLRQMGITDFSEAFERWYKCVVGGLDATPDFVGNKLNPDSFINTCNDHDCPERGKFCGRASMLRNFEVETIHTLEQGHSITTTAKILCVSVPAIKKRVENINVKLGTRNMASMIATSGRLGII